MTGGHVEKERMNGAAWGNGEDPLMDTPPNLSPDPAAKGLHLVFAGVSHRTAPLTLLESIALSPEEVRRALPDIQQSAGLSEALLLAGGKNGVCCRTDVRQVVVGPWPGELGCDHHADCQCECENPLQSAVAIVQLSCIFCPHGGFSFPLINQMTG